MSKDESKLTTIRFSADMLDDAQFNRSYFESLGFVLSETELIRVAGRHLRRSIQAHHYQAVPPTQPVVDTPRPPQRGRRKKPAP